MRPLFQHLLRQLAEFEAWFERKFGWFFTNGMKQDESGRTAPVPEAGDPLTAKV